MAQFYDALRLTWQKKKKKKKITVGGRGAGVEAVEVVRLAEDASLVQSKLFTGAELASAGVAGETRQVVDVFAGPPHPIGGRYRTAAAGALGSKSPKLHPIISQHCKTSLKTLNQSDRLTAV